MLYEGFRPGTEVLVKRGVGEKAKPKLKKIEDLLKGDEILGYDLAEKKYRSQKVVKVRSELGFAVSGKFCGTKQKFLEDGKWISYSASPVRRETLVCITVMPDHNFVLADNTVVHNLGGGSSTTGSQTVTQTPTPRNQQQTFYNTQGLQGLGGLLGISAQGGGVNPVSPYAPPIGPQTSPGFVNTGQRAVQQAVGGTPSVRPDFGAGFLEGGAPLGRDETGGPRRGGSRPFTRPVSGGPGPARGGPVQAPSQPIQAPGLGGGGGGGSSSSSGSFGGGGSALIPVPAPTDVGLFQQAAQQFNPSLVNAQGLLDRTTAGEFLDPASAPFLQQTIDLALGRQSENFLQNVVPGIESAAQAGGAFGGSRHGLVEAAGQRDLLREQADAASQIAFQNYSNERQAQQNVPALLQQLQSLQTDPAQGILQGSMADRQNQLEAAIASGQLGIAGSNAATSRYSANAAAENAKFNAQTSRLNSLFGGYGSLLGAARPQGYNTTTVNQQPRGTSFLQGLTGGFSSAAGLGSLMAPAGATGLAALGGLPVLGIGAGLGALGGLFG